MPISACFPTYIYYEPLKKKGTAKFTEELLGDCYKIKGHDLEGKKWSEKNYQGGYSSYGTITHLHKMSSSFISLEKLISKHVSLFVKHLEYNMQGRELLMTDCWVNIMPRGTVHSMHLHPLSTISGTYYLKTPPNCSKIKFEDPRMSNFMAQPPRSENCRKENLPYIKYEPKAGNLILFESWLRHEVAANPAAEERVSISFNYNWF